MSELVFSVAVANTRASDIRAATHCNVCGGMVDEVAVVEEFDDFNPTIVVRCHGEVWKQKHPGMFAKTFRIIVPPVTNLLPEPATPR